MASLYLIDGHNVLYRTFFGVPRLTAPDGTPTNVVLGVARILLKILREERPDAVVAVFDSREPTPRHALYPEYKANRLKTPEDLAAQIPVVDEMIDALGVRRLSVAGAEADDIIGTLSRRAEERGMDVVIVSSDKDMYQLVSPRVKVRDGLKEHTVGEAQVEEVFGVPPGKVADLLALAGDPSDNVPGVPGIGEKTASELIRDFGSLDAVLAHPERLKGARREKIEKGADAARLALRLVTIDRDIPIREDWSEFTPRGIDASRVVPLFRRLGFRKLLEELDLGKETPPEEKGDAPKSVAWKRAGSVEELLHALGPGDIASAGLAYDGDRETVVGIAVEGKGVHLLPADASARAARALSARGATIYLHDGKALYRRDAGAGTGEDPRLFDTQVAGYLLEPEEGTPSFPKLRARFLPASLAAAEGESPSGPCGRAGDRDARPGESARGAARGGGPARCVPGDRHAAPPRPPPDRGERDPDRSRDLRGTFRGARPRHLRHRAEGGGGRGDRFQHQLPEAAGLPPLRKAGASPRQEDEDRLLHGRGRPGAPERPPRDPVAGARIPDRREDPLHLRRRPAGEDRPAGRADPHDALPDAGGHRAALLLRSEPAEHPDPHRTRPPDPGRVRRGEGEPVRRGGLLPGGAAPARAPVRGRGADPPVPAGGRYPYRDGGRRLRRRPVRRHPGAAASGEGDQLRHPLRHEPLRPVARAGDRRERGEDVHRPLFRPVPRSKGIH